MSGVLYIISAPSGSGKSTLVNEMRKFVPNLEFSISYTTRAPRGSEINGRLEESVDQLQAIVLGERAHHSGKTPSPDEKRYLEMASKSLKSSMEGKIKGILSSFDVLSPKATEMQR